MHYLNCNGTDFFYNFQKAAKNKQSPVGRQFDQSGHPGRHPEVETFSYNYFPAKKRRRRLRGTFVPRGHRNLEGGGDSRKLYKHCKIIEKIVKNVKNIKNEKNIVRKTVKNIVKIEKINIVKNVKKYC
jgi:hypothetical protein